MSDPQGQIATRASATGNTFMLVEGLPKAKRSEVAQRLCQGFVGFYTDGLIVLDEKNGVVNWDFYNANGSSAEMCGNGTRCVAQFYYRRRNYKALQINTAAGAIHTKIIKDGLVETEMTMVDKIFERSVTLDSKKISGLFIETGVPHFVLSTTPDSELAEKLRGHQDFGSLGTNVTFAETLSAGSVRAVTFERGVEDFTLSCGTGAVAAAVMNIQKHQGIKSCRVEMPGGMLDVEWSLGHRPKLTGPAQIEFTLQLED